MSDRLTSEWTPTAEGAFGQSGKKGRIGELFMMEVLKTQFGYDVVDYEDDYEKQISGIDIGFKSPAWRKMYTGDVKNNQDKYGNFYVYPDWLFITKADRIFHVCPESGWLTYYGVPHMKDWCSYNKDKLVDGKYWKLSAPNLPPEMVSFVTKMKFNGNWSAPEEPEEADLDGHTEDSYGDYDHSLFEKEEAWKSDDFSDQRTRVLESYKSRKLRQEIKHDRIREILIKNISTPMEIIHAQQIAAEMLGVDMDRFDQVVGEYLDQN